MKHTSTIALLIGIMVSATAFSSPVIHDLKFSVVYNSNLTVQQPVALLMSFSSSGTDALDANDYGNQFSLGSLNEMVYPFSLTSDNTIVTYEDARATLQGYSRIAFGFATKFPATIRLSTSLFSNSMDTTNRPAYAWLEQISTGNIYPLIGDTIELSLPANLNFESDFYLHTGLYISKTVEDATCFGSTNGKISVINPNVNHWIISIYQNTTQIISTPVNQPDTVIGNLAAGNYSVITTVNSIEIDSAYVLIKSPDQIFPNFSIDNNHPTTDEIVTFTNTSTGSVTYSWDFGDGNYDSQENTSNQFLSPGNYEVILTAINSVGCQVSVSDSVFVTEAPITIHQGPNFNPNFDDSSNGNTETNHSTKFDPSLTYDQNVARIVITQNDAVEMTVRILDRNGRLISAVTSSNSTTEISFPQTGIYLVQMISQNGEIKTKTVFINE